jgi:hypothetical protein
VKGLLEIAGNVKKKRKKKKNKKKKKKASPPYSNVMREAVGMGRKEPCQKFLQT